MHRRTTIAVITGTCLTALTGSNADENDGSDENETRPSTAEDTRAVDAYNGEQASGTESDEDATEDTDVSFEVAPYELTRCGTTCGEATTTLTNTGSADATDVVVTVRIFVGDDLLFETDETVGRLEAGAEITRTERLEFGFDDILAVRENGGQVTITTIIESSQGTERIDRERSL